MHGYQGKAKNKTMVPIGRQPVGFFGFGGFVFLERQRF